MLIVKALEMLPQHTLLQCNMHDTKTDTKYILVSEPDPDDPNIYVTMCAEVQATDTVRAIFAISQDIRPGMTAGYKSFILPESRNFLTKPAQRVYDAIEHLIPANLAGVTAFDADNSKIP